MQVKLSYPEFKKQCQASQGASKLSENQIIDFYKADHPSAFVEMTPEEFEAAEKRAEANRPKPTPMYIKILLGVVILKAIWFFFLR